jgi:hypothetical protein
VVPNVVRGVGEGYLANEAFSAANAVGPLGGGWDEFAAASDPRSPQALGMMIPGAGLRGLSSAFRGKTHVGDMVSVESAYKGPPELRPGEAPLPPMDAVPMTEAAIAAEPTVKGKGSKQKTVAQPFPEIDPPPTTDVPPLPGPGTPPATLPPVAPGPEGLRPAGNGMLGAPIAKAFDPVGSTPIVAESTANRSSGPSTLPPFDITRARLLWEQQQAPTARTPAVGPIDAGLPPQPTQAVTHTGDKVTVAPPKPPMSSGTPTPDGTGVAFDVAPAPVAPSLAEVPSVKETIRAKNAKPGAPNAVNEPSLPETKLSAPDQGLNAPARSGPVESPRSSEVKEPVAAEPAAVEAPVPAAPEAVTEPVLVEKPSVVGAKPATPRDKGRFKLMLQQGLSPEEAAGVIGLPRSGPSPDGPAYRADET